MPETQQEKEKRELRELEGKNIAHYSVLLDAWVQTKMERDKTLVNLSAGGIALLTTLLTTVGIKENWEIFFYIASFICFLMTIWTSIHIYQLNSKHIEDEIKHYEEKTFKQIKEQKKLSLTLEKFDQLSLGAFIFGSVFAFSVGFSTATNQLITKKGGEIMSDKKQAATQQNTGSQKSLTGLSNVRPSTTSSSGSSSSQGQGSSNSGEK